MRPPPSSARAAATERVSRWTRDLFSPVDGASLAVFRIVLGTMIAWDVARYFAYGWITDYYVEPKWNFTYLYFDWVKPWPGNGMYLHFALMGVCALMVAAGFYYRVAIVALWLLYTLKFLMEKSVYMNHYYLIGLLCFLFIFLHANRVMSRDRLRHPEWKGTVPLYDVLLLRFQLVVVYAFGAIAKIDPDWLRGEPMYSELVRGEMQIPVWAPPIPLEWIAYGISYGGLALDAALPVLLCFRRTRQLGFLAACVFHLLNDFFLSIGVFSYLMIGALTIFFDPNWPRQVAAWWRGDSETSEDVGSARAAKRKQKKPKRRSTHPQGARQRLVVAAITVWALVQLLVPLRHHLYPGWVTWTEEGHRFSWRMKLRDKWGRVELMATDPARGESFLLDPFADLGDRQVRKMHVSPDILLEYVHYKAADLRAQGIADPQIRVAWMCSLNGAPPMPLVDSTIDLTREERSIWPARWLIR